MRECVIAGGKLQAKDDAGGHVGRETRIDPHHANIAKRRMTEYAWVIGIGGAEITVGIGHFHHRAPVVIEHVLAAREKEIRADMLVVIVRGRRARIPAPIFRLVEKIIFGENRAARARRQQRTGAHVENRATAGAGKRHAGRAQRCHARRRYQQKP